MRSLGRFKLKDSVVCGFGLDGGAMFGVVPRPLWSKHFPPDHAGRIALVTRSLIVDAPHLQRSVVLDVGMGIHIAEKVKQRNLVTFTHGDQAGAFIAAGLRVDQVTDVIITHLHFDHAAGLVLCTGDSYQPLFPNAIHHVQRAAWDWAQQPTERDRGSFILDGLSVLAERKLLSFVDGDTELLPGLRVMVCNGHTPGMQLVWIEDQGALACYASDLIPTAAHIRLPWIMAYDLQPLVTLAEKRQVLTRLVQYDGLLCLEHDPSCAAVTLRDGDEGMVCLKERITAF